MKKQLKNGGLTLCAVQHDVVWEDPEANFRAIEDMLRQQTNKAQLILLPEFFSVGFSPAMATVAELPSGISGAWMKRMASAYDAIVAGTIPTKTDRGVVNRFWWVSANGHAIWYDKFHLFGMGGESERLVAGIDRVLINAHQLTFMPQVCYDLRFPVFARNAFSQGQFMYDVLVYSANWPAARAHHWRSLLVARAIENQCYVIGINRTGTDGVGLEHRGDTMVIDFKGNIMTQADGAAPQLVEVTLQKGELTRWRNQFAIASDWDHAPLPVPVMRKLG